MPSSYRRVTEPSLKRAPGEREKKGFLGLLEPLGKKIALPLWWTC